MRAAADLTLSALGDYGIEPLRRYASTLREACEAAPPPFGMEWYGEKYRKVSVDPNWMAGSLVANASKEGEGAQKLWKLAGRTANKQISVAVKGHAVDEARHAKLYIGMLDLAFPDSVPSELRPQLLGLSPGYRANQLVPSLPPAHIERVLDELVQMNIGEIRTRIHQLLLKPVLTLHCPKSSRPKLSKILRSILVDETRHIGYTARLIEQYAVNGYESFIRKTMVRRLSDFNDITMTEVGESSYDGA